MNLVIVGNQKFENKKESQKSMKGKYINKSKTNNDGLKSVGAGYVISYTT